MSATKRGSILQTLELDAAIIESLPEPVLSELIGFIEYDNRLDREELDTHDDSAPRAACCPSSANWPDD